MGNNVPIYVLNLDKGVGAIVGKAAEVTRSAFGVIQGVRNLGVRQWEARELCKDQVLKGFAAHSVCCENGRLRNDHKNPSQHFMGLYQKNLVRIK